MVCAIFLSLLILWVHRAGRCWLCNVVDDCYSLCSDCQSRSGELAVLHTCCKMDLHLCISPCLEPGTRYYLEFSQMMGWGAVEGRERVDMCPPVMWCVNRYIVGNIRVFCLVLFAQGTSWDIKEIISQLVCDTFGWVSNMFDLGCVATCTCRLS